MNLTSVRLHGTFRFLFLFTFSKQRRSLLSICGFSDTPDQFLERPNYDDPDVIRFSKGILEELDLHLCTLYLSERRYLRESALRVSRCEITDGSAFFPTDSIQQPQTTTRPSSRMEPSYF
jgi:hypothetical protein